MILHIGVGPSPLEEVSHPRIIVDDARSRFDLCQDIWIERLDKQLAINIQRACEPPHHGVSKNLHDRHLYAFVNKIREEGRGEEKELGELLAATALSRLIHPTIVGDRYCATVIHWGRPDSEIHAQSLRGRSTDIFLGNPARDWLYFEEGLELRQLMSWVAPNKVMHRRVHRAYWNHEGAMRSYFLDDRWPLRLPSNLHSGRAACG